MNLDDDSHNLTPLLETILSKVPPTKADVNLPARLQSFTFAYDNFLGRLAICRVYEEKLKIGDPVFLKQRDGKTITGKLTKIFSFEGLKRVEIPEAMAGDIVMIAGLPDVYIGETICSDESARLLPSINIDEPTISFNFMVNDSMFMDGKSRALSS